MKDAIKEIFPPDVPPLVRWRLAIFSTCCSMLVFMSWALSPWGFALAQEMNKMRDNVDEMRLSQIEQQVYDVKQMECVSTDLVTERFFANRVMELNRKYRALTRTDVRIPPCVSGKEAVDE